MTRKVKLKKRTPNPDAPVWEAMRAHYSEEAQRQGDAACGLITLRDLLALEVVEHGRLSAASGGAKGKNAIALTAARVQSRKNLRRLVVACGPSMSEPAIEVRVPEGYSLEEMQAKVDAMEDDEILS